MISEEQSPLATLGNVRCLRHNVRDWVPVLHAQRHEDSRHDRKMKGHVAFVAFAEIGTHVGRPLVRLGQKHASVISLIEFSSDSLDNCVSLRKILAVCSVTLDKIWNRIKPQTVHIHVQPKTHRLKNALEHFRIVEIQIGLMRKKTVPVVSICDGIPGPVRFLCIGKNDSSIAVLLVGVAPNVDVTIRRA